MSEASQAMPGREAEDTAPLILVLDYGMGNLRSVEKALEHVGARATIGADPDEARAADGLILPGVGAFPRAMERIGAHGGAGLARERRGAGGAPTASGCPPARGRPSPLPASRCRTSAGRRSAGSASRASPPGSAARRP